MNLQLLKDFFLWCTLFNFAFFFLSFILIKTMKNFITRIHGKLYDIPEEKIRIIIYKSMLYYKTAIVFFNLVPYLALKIIT